MEDISRELEREIARAKPTPHKASRKKKILVVDDYGVLKSGNYLKVMVQVLAVASLVFGFATGSLYVMYGSKSKENTEMRSRLAMLEKKTDQLTDEKEILMARLVMAGEKPILKAAQALEEPSQTPGIKSKKPEVKKVRQPEPDSLAEAVPEEKSEPEIASAPAGEKTAVPSDAEEEQVSETAAAQEPSEEALASGDTRPDASAVVAVEKFSVSHLPDERALRVRFDIRNTKTGPGEISGRIFLVLKPENGGEENWIVAPKAPLGDDGVPSVYRRGQYFSISRFKPVKFTIPSPSDPGRLKKAAVYIFDDNGQLIFKDVMPVTLETATQEKDG